MGSEQRDCWINGNVPEQDPEIAAIDAMEDSLAALRAVTARMDGDDALDSFNHFIDRKRDRASSGTLKISACSYISTWPLTKRSGWPTLG